MGYQVKWLEENLGITRDMIRNYEKKELIPKNNGGAKRGKDRYRDYTWEQVEALWLIRANQAFGFTLQEIKEMACESDLDMRDVIDEKIQELEKKKAENEKALSCLKTIKLNGQMPVVTEVGAINYETFKKLVLEKWPTPSDKIPNMNPLIEFVETGSSDYITEEGEPDWNKLHPIIQVFNNMLHNMDDIDPDELELMIGTGFRQRIYISKMIEMKEKPIENIEIQVLAKFIHDELKKIAIHEKVSDDMVVQNFINSMIGWGDVAKSQQAQYGGIDNCKYVVDAVALYCDYDMTEWNQYLNGELR